MEAHVEGERSSPKGRRSIATRAAALISPAALGAESASPLTWDDISSLMAELQIMAHGLLANEGNRRGVQTLGLVCTAIRRLFCARKDWLELKIPWEQVTWKDRHQFFALAYRAMRQALIDYARAGIRSPVKGGAELGALRLEELAAFSASSLQRAEAVNAAIEALRRDYPKEQLAEIVEHYSFGGLTQSEIASLLKISERTVRDRFHKARAILALHLKDEFPQLKIP